MCSFIINICDAGPNIYDNKQSLVVFIDIWQKLSSVERGITLIVTDFWVLRPVWWSG